MPAVGGPQSVAARSHPGGLVGLRRSVQGGRRRVLQENRSIPLPCTRCIPPDTSWWQTVSVALMAPSAWPVPDVLPDVLPDVVLAADMLICGLEVAPGLPEHRRCTVRFKLTGPPKLFWSPFEAFVGTWRCLAHHRVHNLSGDNPFVILREVWSESVVKNGVKLWQKQLDGLRPHGRPVGWERTTCLTRRGAGWRPKAPVVP